MKTEKVYGTIVFIDIIDFLKEINKTGIKKVIDLLNEYYISIGNAVYNKNGKIIKYIGDAVLLFFEGKNQADNAVEALINCRFPENIKAHCSVNSGEVYKCTIGHPKLISDDIFGDDVNITALQEKAYNKDLLKPANPYIIISENTKKIFYNDYKTIDLGKWKIRTTDKMINSYQILF